MPRSRPEWIGKDDDARPPKAVRLRVLTAYEGRCYLTGRVIRAGDEWDLEHVKPLAMARAGEKLNRESNLAPALKAPHQEKTAREAKGRSKADRVRLKHLGQWPASKSKIRSRGFPPSRPGVER